MIKKKVVFSWHWVCSIHQCHIGWLLKGPGKVFVPWRELCSVERASRRWRPEVTVLWYYMPGGKWVRARILLMRASKVLPPTKNKNKCDQILTWRSTWKPDQLLCRVYLHTPLHNLWCEKGYATPLSHSWYHGEEEGKDEWNTEDLLESYKQRLSYMKRKLRSN